MTTKIRIALPERRAVGEGLLRSVQLRVHAPQVQVEAGFQFVDQLQRLREEETGIERNDGRTRGNFLQHVQRDDPRGLKAGDDGQPLAEAVGGKAQDLLR